MSQSVGLDRLEVLIVDDKSSDGSAKLIEKLIEENSNIKGYFMQKNSGNASTGRNFGITKARGEYIYFLDSDDEIASDGLETLYKIAKETKDKFVVGKTVKVYDNFEKVSYKQHSDRELRNYPINKLRRMWWGGFAPASKLLDRKTIVENNLHFPNLKYGEDVKFYFDFLSNIETVSQTEKLITRMNRRSDNAGLISSSSVLESFDGNWQMISYIANSGMKKKFALKFLARRFELTALKGFLMNEAVTSKHSKSLGFKLRKREIVKLLNRFPEMLPYIVSDERREFARKLLKSN
jgi:glycosyltransferase involved in cell wall biosynthesis